MKIFYEWFPIRCLAALAVVLGCLVSGHYARGAEPPPASGDWPAWRGDGSGVADAKQLPLVWSDTENVLWRTGLPGEGNSSPVVCANRVFLTASLDEGAKRLALCLDAESGKILWQTELLPDAKSIHYPKTGFAAPTPATDGERVYVFFDLPGLVALDMQGKVVWTCRLGPFKSPYNMASSPILYKDMVIQCCDQCGPAFIVAIQRSNGQERWRTPRKSSSSGHYSTPLVIQVQGRQQVVVNAEPIVAYDADTGEELWSCRGMRECVSPSAAFGQGLVYAASGRIGPVMAIDPTGRGDVTETHVRWHVTSGGPYVPTPLVYPHLLVPGDNGRMAFYNAAGQLVAEDRVRDHFSASPVGADGKIYWSSERGKTYVLDAAALAGEKPSVKMLAVNQLNGTILASPAIAHGRLFVRTDEALYCIGSTGKASVASSAKAVSGTFVELKERYDKYQAHFQDEVKAKIRLEILEAIAKLDGPEIIPYLLYIAQKEQHWDICEEAAKSLGRKGEPAIDSLIELLPDSRPFIRTTAVEELGRLKVAKAVPGLLLALKDRQPLIRSASLQSLAQIGQRETPDFPQIVAAMLAALADQQREEAVVRQSALEGLAALAGRVTAQRQEVIRSLLAVQQGRNPRLAKRAQEILQDVYKPTPAELEKVRRGAVDWPQWGGTANKNMATDEKQLPDSFVPGEKDTRTGIVDLGTAKNVKWARKVCQSTYSTPVVAGGKVFLCGQENTGIIACMDEQTGKLLWKWQAGVPAHGFGICGTPVVEFDRLYLVNQNCVAMCLDVNGEPDGPDRRKARVLWTFDMVKELKTEPADVYCGSCVIDGDVLYAPTSNGIDPLGPRKQKMFIWDKQYPGGRKIIEDPSVYKPTSPDAPNVVAFDKKTGRLVATDAMPIGKNVLKGQWSSIALAKVADRNLLFYGGGDGRCYALQSLTSVPEKPTKLRTVWSYDCNPAEYKQFGKVPMIVHYYLGDARWGGTLNKNDGTFAGMGEIIGTPVFYQDRVYVAIGRDTAMGRGRGALQCIDATKTGDTTTSGKVWTYQGLDWTTATVSIAGGLLYVVDVAGRLHCLDAETGQCCWIHESNAKGPLGSTLVADGKVYLPTPKGLTVLAAGREKKVLSNMSVGAPIYSTPVVANGTLYIVSNKGWIWAVGQ